MGMRAVFTITAGLFLLVTLFYGGQASADTLQSVTREALQAYNAYDYEKALEKGQQALELARKSGDKQAVGVSLAFLGGVYSDLEQYEEALGYLEEALAIKREAGDRAGLAAALGEAGIVYSSIGRYEKALKCHEEALAIHKEIGTRSDVGGDLAEIGIVYSYLSRYEKALGFFDEALAIHKETGARNDIGGDLAEIGIVYSYLDQNEKALNYFEEALAIHKEINARKDVGEDLAEIGIVYSSLGQYEKALKYYEEALAIEKEIGDRNGLGKSLGNMGNLYSDLGRNEDALKHYEESLAIYREVGDRQGAAIDLTAIGSVYSILDQNEKAYETLGESLKISTEIGAPDTLWRALCELGKASAKLGKDLEAVSHYEKAIDTIEAMRAGLSEQETKIIFMSGKIFVYDELIELYQKMHAQDPSKGYDKKALEIFERKQGRVFLEEMGKSGARDFSGLPATVKESETDLENRMEKAQAGIAAERSKDAKQRDAARLQNLEAGLKQVRAAYRTLQEEIKAKYPDYYALKYPEPAGLKDIQEQVLSADEILLVYGVMKDSACLWVIGKKRFGFYPVSIGENQLGQKVNSWRKGVASIIKILTGRNSPRENAESVDAGMKAVSNEGHELYELLIPKDVRAALSGAKTLYIVPSGPLYGLPFEALVSRMDGEIPRYLVEDCPMAYLSSASLLKTLREAQARKKTKVRYPLIAFANPVYGKSEAPGATRGEPEVADLRARAYRDLMGGSFLELPETEEEAREIKDVLLAADSSMPLQLRQNASRSNVLKLNAEQKLADYRYVVFSCHGVVPDVTNRVSQPALVLSQPDPVGGAGFLTMADTFDLRLDADLVTLSACNTGRGIEARGEGVMGLTRSFMYAGTPAISVTLWSVESQSAKTLSTGLYENLKAGRGRAEALRDIKLHMIRGEEDENYRYPYFWAPLVLFGDGR